MLFLKSGCYLVSNSTNLTARTQVGIASNPTFLRDRAQSAVITALDFTISPTDNSPNAVNGYQLGLDEEDLRYLEPGSPLTDKVVNAVLRLLGSLAPFDIVTINSSAHKIILPGWLQPKDQSTRYTILVPIHILLSGH